MPAEVNPEIITIAFNASASVIGCARLEIYASIACVNASTPTAAVKWGGVVTDNSGSTSATAGSKHALLSIILTLRSVSVSTVTFVTSLPVPPVVGIAIKGAPSVRDFVYPHIVRKFAAVSAFDSDAFSAINCTTAADAYNHIAAFGNVLL